MQGGKWPACPPGCLRQEGGLEVQRVNRWAAPAICRPGAAAPWAAPGMKCAGSLSFIDSLPNNAQPVHSLKVSKGQRPCTCSALLALAPQAQPRGPRRNPPCGSNATAGVAQMAACSLSPAFCLSASKYGAARFLVPPVKACSPHMQSQSTQAHNAHGAQSKTGTVCSKLCAEKLRTCLATSSVSAAESRRRSAPGMPPWKEVSGGGDQQPCCGQLLGMPIQQN